MSSVTARTILEVWDLAADQTAARRVVLLIGALAPEIDRNELGDLSVGDCNVVLLRLRAALFGRLLRPCCTCDACGERFEFSIDCDDLIGAHDCDVANESFEIASGGRSIRFRLVTQRDMEAAALCASAEEARAVLLERCLLADVDDTGERVDVRTLSADAVQMVSEAICRADPCAEFAFTVCCPSCHMSMTSNLDVASFLWTEVDALARRLLWDVDALARRYHWTESEILDLSPRRRHAYLQMGQV